MNMQLIPLSPLQLKNHFFAVCSVRANTKATPPGDAIMDVDIGWEKVPNQANHWALRLQVTVKSTKPEAPCFYDCEFQVLGVVEFNGDMPEEKKEQIVAVNGLGILYSSVREMMTNVTARGPYGGVSLPTVNFIQLVADKKARIAEAQVAATVAPAPVASAKVGA